MITIAEVKEIGLKYGLIVREDKTEITLGVGSSIYHSDPTRCVEPDVIWVFKKLNEKEIYEWWKYLFLVKEDEGYCWLDGDHNNHSYSPIEKAEVIESIKKCIKKLKETEMKIKMKKLKSDFK